MNTTKNQFSIGIDGNYLTVESKSSFVANGSFHRSEGANLLRGR
jgi:hypothetical protein